LKGFYCRFDVCKCFWKCNRKSYSLEKKYIERYNLVKSFEEVKNIDPDVVPLKTIYLEHNPIAKEFLYRKELKAIHKGLTQIDATYVR